MSGTPSASLSGVASHARQRRGRTGRTSPPSTRRDTETLLERPPLETPVPSVRLPQVFGPYLLVEQIGAGGMAEVFKALVLRGKWRGRALAIKRIRAELSEAPHLVRMLADEARITALLDHPNIVRVFDFGRTAESCYLAMEYLDGKDLASVMSGLRSAALSLRSAPVAEIALQIARGLDYAHMLRDPQGRPCRIVHRDVNPANIMLDRSGHVKILDFGVVKTSAFLRKSHTREGRIKGKLAYLSPEQARGEQLDGRSDVFSLGIMMWEMLTGCRLFWADTAVERIQNVVHAPIVAPSARHAAVPAALDRIVLRALERDPSRRYDSAREMVDDLEGFLRAGPVRSDAVAHVLAMLFGDARRSTAGQLPPPFSAVTRPRDGAASAEPSRRPRRAVRWGAAALVLAAGLVAAAASFRHYAGAPPPSREAGLPASPAPPRMAPPAPSPSPRPREVVIELLPIEARAATGRDAHSAAPKVKTHRSFGKRSHKRVHRQR
jgi:serine/threonine protein kinase